MSNMHRVVDRLLEDAGDAVLDRRWPDVASLAGDVLVLDPDNEEAARLLALSERKAGGLTHEQRVPPKRRQLTVLMCDQEDSSGFSDRHDAETVHDVDVAFHEAVHWAVERHGGKIHHHQGDGVLAYFGFPRGQEDAARRAVDAGLDLYRQLAPLQARVAHDLGDRLVVRIAVHTDTAVVADFEEAVRSRTAAVSGRIGNLASRLQQLSDGRSVIISEATHALIEGQFIAESMGPVTLRGFSDTVVAFRIDAHVGRPAEPATSPATPFIGRRSEVSQLLDTWNDVETSCGATTILVGEPGLGKSRLIREVERAVTDAGGQVLRTACAVTSRAEQWYSLRRLLGSVAGFRHDDDNEERWTKLSAALLPIVPDPTRDLPLLAHVAGIPGSGRFQLPDLHPAALRELTLCSARDVLTHLAAATPTLLVVEDIHWSDPSSWELLTRVAAETAADRLWLLMSSRDERHASEMAAGVVRLSPLSDHDATMLASTLTDLPSDSEAVSTIVSRANGVPLYIQELASSVRWKRPSDVELPLTLRDLLQSRLDVAGTRARRIAQVLSTIGAEAEERLLDEVLSRLGLASMSIDSSVRRLADAGIVEYVPERAEPTLRFHHVLLQEAAYSSQLAIEREERHGCVADVLAEQGEVLENPHAAGIARHLALGDRPGEALLFYGVAVQQAIANAAYRESLDLLDAALQVVDRLPDDERTPSELNLRMWRAYAHTSAEGYASPSVLAEYERSLELCWTLRREDRARRHVTHALIGLWASLAIAGQLSRTADVLSATVGLEDDPDAADLSHVILSCRGMDLLFRGELVESEALLTASLDRYDHDGSVPEGWVLPNCPMVATLATLGLCLVLRGEPGRAREIADWSMKRAATLPFPMGPYSTAFAKVYRAMGLRNADEPEAARAEALDAIEIGERYGFAEMIWTGRIHLAAIDAATGDPAAVEALVAAVDGWQATGGGAFLPCFLAEAAEAMLRQGDLERARSLLGRASLLADSSGQRTHATEISRVQAELRRAEGADGEEIERIIRPALALAELQGARLFELKLRRMLGASDGQRC